MSKQGEVNYPKNLSKEGYQHLLVKPWCKNDYRNFFDFAAILQVLDLPAGGRILDLGVGPGWTSIFLARCGYEVVGVDISPGMVGIAERRSVAAASYAASKAAHAAAAKVVIKPPKFTIADMENLTYENEFDAVLIYDSLHHCNNQKDVLESAYNALKKGGQIIIYEPPFPHYISPHAKYVSKKYSVTERGISGLILKKDLRGVGYKNIVQYFEGPRLFKSSLFGWIKVFAALFLTRLFGFPRRVLVTARK